MALLYFDREGRPLEQAAWFKKIRDPNETIVKITENKNHSIRTSWVGVGSTLEPIFLLFHVECLSYFRGPGKRNGTWKNIKEVWFATEAEALQEHRQMERDLRS